MLDYDWLSPETCRNVTSAEPMTTTKVPKSGAGRRSGRSGARGRPRAYRVIDLFCGAGGLSAGFEATKRFRTVWANDVDAHAAATFDRNFDARCDAGDIVAILRDRSTEIPRADVVIGGPPCQGFSLLNKNRDGDPRKQLWRPYLQVVELSGADAFVMENVPQLLASDEFAEIETEARRLGFTLKPVKLCAADYGVPQTRWRAFVLGLRNGDPAVHFPPLRTHYNPRRDGPTRGTHVPGARPWRTVRDAIGDLTPPHGNEVREVPPPYDLHFGRRPTPVSERRYRAIPDEGMNRFDLQERAPKLTPGCWIRKTSGGTDLFGRLWWDRPAFTIRTEFFKPEKGRYLHPVEHRPITHREAARLQTFPDKFEFKGTKIEIARQIGNAVPPLLARRVAESVVAALATARR